jgi:hypothetical protein
MTILQLKSVPFFVDNKKLAWQLEDAEGVELFQRVSQFKWVTARVVAYGAHPQSPMNHPDTHPDTHSNPSTRPSIHPSIHPHLSKMCAKGKKEK